MMWKTNISKIVNSASISFENYFLWVHIKMQLLGQKTESLLLEVLTLVVTAYHTKEPYKK